MKRRNIVLLILILILLGVVLFIQEDIFAIDKSESKKMKTEVVEGEFTSLGSKKNLVVLQIESLQNFIIGKTYYGQEITPNINEIVGGDSSLYFNNYYEMNSKGYSGDGEFVSNNSLYPAESKPSYREYEGVEFYGLPSILKSNKYETILMTGHDKSYWNREKVYKDQGFNHLISRENFTDEEGFRDEDLFKEALGKVKDIEGIKKKPFYLYMTNSESHKPFKIRDEDRALDIEGDNPLVDYVQNMNYIDRCIGEFIEDLKEKELYDDTILVIQGSGFGLNADEPSISSGVKKFTGAKYTAWDMYNVPLVINIPGLKDGRIIDRMGSQLDFYPIMANIMGCGTREYALGKDIVNDKGYNPLPLFNEYKKGSFLDDRNILIASGEDFSKAKAYEKDTEIPLDLKMFGDTYEDILAELSKSRDIVRNEFMEDGRKDKLIMTVNKMDEIGKLYRDGYRFFNIVDIEEHRIMDLMEEYEDIEIVVNEEGKLNSIRNSEVEDRCHVFVWEDNKDKVDYPNTILLTDMKTLEDYPHKGVVKAIKDRSNPMSGRFKRDKTDYVLVDPPHNKRDDIENKHIVAHAGGAVNDSLYTNSLDAMKLSYDEDIRLMEIDFEWTSDDKLVCIHGWTGGFLEMLFATDEGVYTYDEFVDFKMAKGWTKLVPETLEEYLGVNQDIRLVTDIKSRNVEGLKFLRDKYPFLAEKLIPQVYNVDEYDQAKELGYEDIILTMYLINWKSNEEAYSEIIERMPYAVTMPTERVARGLGTKLEEKGIYVYSHTINTMDEVYELEKQGIRGIYTDHIRP